MRQIPPQRPSKPAMRHSQYSELINESVDHLNEDNDFTGTKLKKRIIRPFKFTLFRNFPYLILLFITILNLGYYFLVSRNYNLSPVGISPSEANLDLLKTFQNEDSDVKAIFEFLDLGTSFSSIDDPTFKLALDKLNGRLLKEDQVGFQKKDYSTDGNGMFWFSKQQNKASSTQITK